MDQTQPIPPWQKEPLLSWITWLLDSYQHWIGWELIDRRGTLIDQAERLVAAPFVVASHGRGSDPLLNFGNAQALALWEMTWEEFTSTPSRLTAEPVNQAERARMLQQAANQGFISDYRGIRISKSGKRFLVEQAIVWNVLDPQDNTVGQAATFSSWTAL